jgi:hypothetical protein
MEDPFRRDEWDLLPSPGTGEGLGVGAKAMTRDTGDPIAIDFGADGRASALRFGDIELRLRP